MKEIIKLGLILFIITACASAVLGFTYEITKGPIEEQVQLAKKEAMNQTLPQADTFQSIDVDLPEDSTILEVNAGYKGDNLEGFAVKVSPKGFGGAVEMMVGISKDGVIQGVRILSHAETPGLGANAENPSFSSQYEGKSGQLVVTKTAPTEDNEIQAITGATITSQAVTDGVNEVIELLNHLLDADEVTFDFN
ncbi:RnfABCDGE type electron transport complex subunit G [Defluviitalea phaphyphila]|uniref:RnfABCDGE type electron transport complex subunit G n=1 Tax=Defluviitalea phaphyphila TaxID=1473580 RepID=UPI0007DC4185|nr:RnfABCDGE type electron transport complex subunit G [Defluviitalea phaphyphila]